MSCWILLLAMLTTVLREVRLAMFLPFNRRYNKNLHPVFQPLCAIMSSLLLSLLLVGLKPKLNMVTQMSQCRLALWNNATLCLCKTQSEAKLPDMWCSSCSWHVNTKCSRSADGAEMANAPIHLVPDLVIANLCQIQLPVAPFHSPSQPCAQQRGCVKAGCYGGL